MWNGRSVLTDTGKRMIAMMMVFVLVTTGILAVIPMASEAEDVNTGMPDKDVWPYNIVSDGEETNEHPASGMDVAFCDETGMQLKVSVGSITLDEETASGGPYVAPTVDGYGHTTIVGEPMLPVIRHLVAV
ncbi:MAG: hypothetical protein KAT70_05850, partial [Thermoplasmata archaeon]|nr:hypothetical protein [Thermoplasmata archaeon]